MKTTKKHKTKRLNKPMMFKDIKVGEHFLFGNQEHVRLPIVATGEPTIIGYFNCAQIGSGQVSGMGPEVSVVRIHHKPRDYNGFFFE